MREPHSKHPPDLLEGNSFSAEARIRAWLKRTVLVNALSNVAFGGIILIAALVVLAITFVAILGIVWTVWRRVSAVVSLSTGTPTWISFEASVWISIALVGLLFLFNDWHSKHRSELSQIRRSDLLSPKLLSAMAILIADLLFAGPQLVSI